MPDHDDLSGGGLRRHWEIDNFMSPPVWHTVGATGEPAYLNGATGGLKFCKDAFGFVHIEGSVVIGSAAAVFVLPVGYRPTAQVGYPVGTLASGVPRCIIATDGTVYAYDGIATLSAIAFYAG